MDVCVVGAFLSLFGVNREEGPHGRKHPLFLVCSAYSVVFR